MKTDPFPAPVQWQIHWNRLKDFPGEAARKSRFWSPCLKRLWDGRARAGTIAVDTSTTLPHEHLKSH